MTRPDLEVRVENVSAGVTVEVLEEVEVEGETAWVGTGCGTTLVAGTVVSRFSFDTEAVAEDVEARFVSV